MRENLERAIWIATSRDAKPKGPQPARYDLHAGAGAVRLALMAAEVAGTHSLIATLEHILQRADLSDSQRVGVEREIWWRRRYIVCTQARATYLRRRLTTVNSTGTIASTNNPE